MKYEVKKVDGEWRVYDGDRVVCSAERRDLLPEEMVEGQSPPPLGVKVEDKVDIGEKLS